MKQFKFTWGLLTASIVALCVSIYFTLWLSPLFIILDILSFCWIIQMIAHTIKWHNTLENKEECVKISNRLDIYGYFLLFAGLANAIFSLLKNYPDITTVIGLFCFCSFVLSMFFSSIIKLKISKNQKDDGNWA